MSDMCIFILSYIYPQNRRYFLLFLHYVPIYLNKDYFYRALLIKIKKLKRINLLAQKLKRTHGQLTSRSLKKVYAKNDNILPSIKTRQNAGTDLISSLNYTDLYKVSTC